MNWINDTNETSTRDFCLAKVCYTNNETGACVANLCVTRFCIWNF